MKTLARIALCVVLLAMTYYYTPELVHASPSYGATAIGYIAPTVDQCPKSMKKFALLCPVGANGSFSMYVSYDGGAYQQLP